MLFLKGLVTFLDFSGFDVGSFEVNRIVDSAAVYKVRGKLLFEICIMKAWCWAGSAKKTIPFIKDANPIILDHVYHHLAGFCQ